MGSNMAGKGKVEMEELKGQLADHGLALSQTLPQIAALMGITGKTQEQVMDKVRKAIKAGQVSGDVGVYAVYKAMKAAAGGRAAGAATEAGSGTIAGLLSNIKEGLTTVIALQDTENWAGIRALKDLLGSIAGLFRSDSAEGQRLAGTPRVVIARADAHAAREHLGGHDHQPGGAHGQTHAGQHVGQHGRQQDGGGDLPFGQVEHAGHVHVVLRHALHADCGVDDHRPDRADEDGPDGRRVGALEDQQADRQPGQR